MDSNIFVQFLNRIEINDLIVFVAGILGSLIIAINNSTNDKKGVSNFIVGYYSMVITYILLSISPLQVFFTKAIPLILLLAIHLSKSLSLAIFSDDALMHYLKPLQILNYYFFEVLFTSKLYMAYFYAIVVVFFSPVNYLIPVTLLFLVLHLMMQINNNFEVISFNRLYEIRFSKNKPFDFDNSNSDFLSVSLSFIIFMEDRDFIVRKSLLFNPFYTILRKYLLSINKYAHGKEYELLDRDKYFSIYQSGFRLNYFFPIIKFLYSNKSKSKNLSLANIKRGYGTISQQIIRITALKNFGSYERFLYRRKFFVENIYSYYFYKSLEKRYAQSIPSGNHPTIDKGNKKDIQDLAKAYVKRDVLLAYYSSLLQTPMNEHELFDKMINIAKTSKTLNELSESWNEMYSYQIFHTISNSLHWEIIWRLNAD